MKTKKFLKNKKAAIMIYITLIIATLSVILITAVLAPMGATFSTRMYENGEKIMLLGNESTSQIQDTEIREDIQDMYDGALAATEDNIQVNTALFKYSWLFVIVMVVLIGFVYTRRITEYGGGFV